MKFDTPATRNPIDQLKIVGKPTDRIDGPMKTTGTAPYAHGRHDVPNAAYGFVIGSAIARGRITAIELSEARAAPGVLAIVTATNAGPVAVKNAGIPAPTCPDFPYKCSPEAGTHESFGHP
jgi:xanthine dehydrogenase YagR molybdenum-binding subunit